jgi:hypothetical protein
LAEGIRLRKKLLEGLTAGRLEGTDELRHLQAVKPSSFQAVFILVWLRHSFAIFTENKEQDYILLNYS